MRNKIILYIILAVIFSAKVHGEIKNVIIMIPDGTSTSVLALSRWYKSYVSGKDATLYIDPYICGIMKTHCSNAPIGNSSPTASTYYTGQLTLPGYLSMYPQKTSQDLVEIDSTRAYQPLATLFEAAKLNGLASGLVMTCEFPHATPAAAVTHYYDRGCYDVLAKQMAYCGLDVLIGGGAKLVSDKGIDKILTNRGYSLILNDKKALFNTTSNKYWALFGDTYIPYCVEKDTAYMPTLAQMTQKAISSLSKNKNGFILMVEGSKIDWAAHSNDAKSVISEFLDFDEATGIALDFAKRDNNTIVLIMPDHGTGGATIGSYNAINYDKIPLSDFMRPLKNYSITVGNMAQILNNDSTTSIDSLFNKYFLLTIDSEDRNKVYNSPDYKRSPLNTRKGESLERSIASILNKYAKIGFLTYGHTGEDVFFGMYHPDKDERLTGHIENTEIAKYIANQLKFQDNYLELLTSNLFIKHTELFADAKKLELKTTDKRGAKLTVTYNKKNKIEIEAFTNYAYINSKKIEFPIQTVYVDKNKTLYIPMFLKEILRREIDGK